jgi:Leucine-rich repeat (LRR) protein
VVKLPQKLAKDDLEKLGNITSMEISAVYTGENVENRLQIESDAFSKLVKIEHISLRGVKLAPNPHLIAWNGEEDDHEDETRKKHVHLKEEAGEEHHEEISLETLKAKLQFQEKLPPILPYDEYLKFLESHGKLTTFANVTSLKTLKLTDVMIHHPNREMISGLPNLQELTFERCRIKFLGPRFFSGLSALKKLSLANNDILALDFQLFLGLESLESLDLSNNKIDHLSMLSFPHLPKLTDVSIINNPLTDVFPSSFMVFDNLKSLKIGDHEVQVSFVLQHKSRSKKIMKYSVCINNVTVCKLKYFPIKIKCFV